MIWPFNKKKPIDVQKPITNPALKKTIHTFNSNRTEINLLKVISEMKNANFLILASNDELKTTETADKNIVTVEEGSIIKFLNTFNENGEVFTPLFTDWKEIGLWIEVTKDISSWIMPTDEAFNFILKNKGVKGLVINPCTDRWTMTKEQIDNFLKE